MRLTVEALLVEGAARYSCVRCLLPCVRTPDSSALRPKRDAALPSRRPILAAVSGAFGRRSALLRRTRVAREAHEVQSRSVLQSLSAGYPRDAWHFRFPCNFRPVANARTILCNVLIRSCAVSFPTARNCQQLVDTIAKLERQKCIFAATMFASPASASEPS
jgi:hypothetical protein